MIDFTPMIESVKKQKTRDILISKISDYQSGYNKTVSAYNDNFGGWDGSNFEADYKNKYKNVSDTLSQTSNNARSIIKLLELNKQYFDDEYDEIYNSLVGSSENISSMQENADSYNSFYSQFENAAAFNDYAFKKKYNGKTLSEIDDIIKNFSADGSAAEKRWLLQNRDSFMNTNDITSEIASLEGQSAGIKKEKALAYVDYAKQAFGAFLGLGSTADVSFDTSAADTEKENNARLQVLKNMLAAKDDFDVEAAYKKADEKNFWDVITTDYTYADYLNDKDSKNIYGNAVVKQNDKKNIELISNDKKLYSWTDAAGKSNTGTISQLLDNYISIKRALSAGGYGLNSAKYGEELESINKVITDELEVINENLDDNEKYSFNDILASYERNKNKDSTSEAMEDISTFTEKHPILGNVTSVGANIFGSMTAIPSALRTGFEDLSSDDPVILDINAPEWALKNATDEIRQTTSQMITDKAETDFGGEVGNFFYQTGMSLADMGASYLAGGFNPTAYAMIMYSTAATDKIKSVTENGGSIDEALLSGIVAGALEAIFEKIGIDNLVGAITKGSGTSVLKTFLSSALSEGFEELGTDIANSIADAIINGNNSEFNNSVYAYMNSGYSASAAQAAALTDLAKQFGLSFAGGALSGGVIGGVGGRINKISYNNTLREVGRKINSSGNTAEFIDYAKNAGIDTKKAERLYAKSSFEAQLQQLAEESIIAEQEAAAATNEKYNNDAVNNAIIQTAEKLGIKQRLADSQSNLAVGKIFDSLNSGVNEKINTSVATVAEEMLTESDIDRQSSVELAKLISKAVEGTITKSEYKTLAKNQTAMRTLDDITAANNEINRAMINQDFTGLSDNAVRYFDALAPALANGAELSGFTTKKERSKTAEVQNATQNEKIDKQSVRVKTADAETVLEARESVKNIYGDAGTRTVEHLVKRIDGNEDAIRTLFDEYYVAGSLGETDINNVTQRSGITLAPEIQQEVKNQAFAAGISDYHASSQSARGANAVRKGSVTVSKSVSTQISEEQKSFLDLFSRSLGVEINVVPEIFASGKKAEGKYSDGKLYLSEDVFKGDLWASIFSHELGHHLSEIAPEQWRNYKKFVIENIQSNRQRYASILAKKKIEYRQVQNNILDMEIMDEIACDCLELFLYDAKFTSEMIERDRSFVEKVRDWLKKFIEQLSEAIHSFSNKQSARVLNSVMQQRDNYAEGLTLVNSMLEKGAKTVDQAMSQNAEKFDNGTNKNTADEDGGVKYSIATDSEGSYVKVDVNQNIFDGKNIQEMQDIACKFIKDNFKGKVLSVGEYGKAYINKRAGEEYGYPANRRLKDNIKEVKMRSSVELDNLLAVSEFIGNQDDDGRHPEATGGWDVYKTRFEVENTMFSGEVKIMVTDRGYVFYDITKIKELPVNGGQTEYNSVAASGNSSYNRISQNDATVNTHSMQDGEKDTTKFSFAGKNALTADKSLLAEAIELEKNGVDSEDIRQMTGWFRGYDNKWRFEIDDSKFEFNRKGFFTNPDVIRYQELADKFLYGEITDEENAELKTLKKNLEGVKLRPNTLGDYVKHDELFKAYPELKNLKVTLRSDMSSKDHGSYNPQKKEIVLNSAFTQDEEVIKRTLIHEIQHSIQDIEGFSGGAGARNPDYARVEGEVEARDVSKRLGFDAEKRKNTRPDIDRTDVVFVDDAGVSYSFEESDIEFIEDEIVSEQESVQKANENEMTEVIYNLIKIEKPSQKAIYEVSQKILSNTASRMSAKEFAGKLSQLLDYIENGEADIVSIQNETKELARQVISRSDYTDNSAWEQYKDVRKQILRKTFYVNRSDIGAEDIKQAALLAGRRFYITTDTTRRGDIVLDIDEVYEDLHNNNPEFFPDTDSPMQQIENISVFLSATSKRVDNPYASGEMGMSEDFATDILAGEIYHTIVTGIIDRSNGIRTVDISKAKDAASRYYKGIDQLKRQAARYSKDYEKFAIEQKNKTIAYRELARKEVADKKAEIMSGAERRQLISSLKRLYKDSVNLLLGKRSDRLGTPQELKSALFDVVELVNLQNGMYPGSKYNDSILSMRTRLHNMKDALVNYKTQSDAVGNEVVSEYAVDTLEALRKSTQNGKKTIDLLSNDDLRNLVNVLQHVKGLVTDANKMFTEDLNADYDKLGNDIINELKEKKNHLGSTNSLKTLMTTNQLMPEYFFERIGGTLENLFRNIYNTEGEQFRILQRFIADAASIAQKYNFNEWGLKQEKLEYVTSRGDKINIDLFNVMSLYALYQREKSNLGTISETMHILHGGEIEFTEDLGFWKEATNNGAAFVRNHNSNIKKVQDIQKKFADKGKGDSPTKSYFLSEQDVKNLIGLLDAEQQAFADSMVRYLSNDVAAVGNEASRKMFNHDIFLEKRYFPMSVNRAHLATNIDANVNPKQVQNASMTKHVSTFANTAIVVRNFMDVWIEHVNQMSVYAATAPALKDFMRVYNYKTKPPVENKTGNVAVDESERQNTKAYSVKALVKEKFGVDFTDYIEELMRDLNGGYRTVNEFGPLINATKKTAVALSLSCAIQQPAAIARAFSVIDIKNFANYSKSGYDEMMKYSAIAQIKATNGYDTLSGPSLLYEIVNHNNDEKFAQTKMFFESVKKRNGKMAWQCFDEFLFYLPKKMDEITWTAIWNSCKKQVRKEGKFKREDEAFFKAVTEVFENVVRKTQVYDSTFQKSGNLRSKSQLVNMEMAFMTEPTVSWNMLLDAKQKLQSGDKKTATRIVTSVAVSSICAIILKSFIGALRKIEKDDDIEDLLISWFDLSKQNGVSELFGFLPIIKDIYSIFDGYSIERMEFANIERIVKAIDAFDSEEKSMSEKITNFAAALANVFGLPGTTIARGIRTSINVAHNIFHIADEPYTNAMIEATKKGDNQTIAQIYDEQIANGLTKDTILKQYRQAMAKNVSEISEAAQLLARGDESAYYKKCREVIDMGFDYSDVKASIKLLLEEKNSKQNASLLAKVETWVKSSFDFDYIAADIEVPDEYYNPTFSEMVEAVQNGDTSGFTKMYNQLLSDGYTESQIKSNYREAIANEVPEIVTAAEYLQNGETGKYSIEIGKIAESGFALADVKSAVNKYISSNSTGLSEGEKFAGSRISDIGTDVIGSAEVVAEEELFSGAIYDYDMLYETMIEQGVNGADYKKMYNYLLDNGTSKKSIDNAMENRAEKTIKKWINAQNSGDYVTYEACLKELTKYYESRDKAIAVVNEYREKQTKLIENYVNASSENKKSEAKEALIKEFGDWHTALKAVEYYKK